MGKFCWVEDSQEMLGLGRVQLPPKGIQIKLNLKYSAGQTEHSWLAEFSSRLIMLLFLS